MKEKTKAIWGILTMFGVLIVAIFIGASLIIFFKISEDTALMIGILLGLTGILAVIKLFNIDLKKRFEQIISPRPKTKRLETIVKEHA